MKKPVHIGLVLAAVVVLLGGGFVLFRDGPAPDDAPLNALVTTLSDEVSLKQNSETPFVTVEGEAQAQEGSVVKTGARGRALVEIATSTRAKVDFNSEFIIEHVDPSNNQTTIALVAGQVWSRVEKSLEQGEFYEIETQNGVATVRGTSFNAAYADGTTSISVVEGVVQAAARDSETGEVLPETEVEIAAGKTAHIQDGKPIRVVDTPKELLQSTWFSINSAPPKESGDTETPDDAAKQESVPVPSPLPDMPADTEPTPSSNDAEHTGTPDAGEEPGFSVTEMSPTSIALQSDRENTVSFYGNKLDDTAVVVIGEFRIETFTVVDSTQLNVALPYEMPDGTHQVFVFGRDEAQIATPPTDLTITHQNEPQDSEELRG